MSEKTKKLNTLSQSIDSLTNEQKTSQIISNTTQTETTEPSLIQEYMPFALGGWSNEELKQGKAFQANWYQKYMPELLGGWSSEKLEQYQKAAESAGYVDRPNWWGRHMPNWLGGASDEEIKKYDDFAKQYQFVPRPNMWERYMPTWLGGVSDEEVQAYDKYLVSRKGPQKPSLWGRYMPTWLGGTSDEEIKTYDDYQAQKPKEPNFWDKYAPTWLGGMSNEDLAKNQKDQENTVTVFQGVTVGKLREAGFTEEKIQTMQKMVQNERTEQVASEAQNNSLGLKNRFGICAQPLTLEAEDYIKAGISKEEMATIYQIYQTSQKTTTM